MFQPLSLHKFYVISFSLIFWVIFSLPVLAEKQSIKIVTSEWSLYSSERLDSGGFLSEIATTALTRAGYQVTLDFLPWKRALKLTKKGLADALIGASYTKKRTRYFSYPEYSWKTEAVFFALKSHQGHYQKIEGLCPANIGVFAGSFYIEKFKLIKCFNIQTVATIQQNIKKLLAKRIDVFIETKDAVLFHLNKEFSEQASDIIALSPAFKTDKVYIVFSKNTPNYQQIQANFDATIKAMQTDGTYLNILKKHGIVQH